MTDDLISRKAAIEELWKALYEYEDKKEKQYQDSEDLDVGDWIIRYRPFVQTMNDIDRQTILNLPSAQPEPRWIPANEKSPEKPKKFKKFEMHRRYYLVTLASGEVTTVGFDFNRNKWANVGSPVISWMPLPYPWKGEGDE